MYLLNFYLYFVMWISSKDLRLQLWIYSLNKRLQSKIKSFSIELYKFWTAVTKSFLKNKHQDGKPRTLILFRSCLYMSTILSLPTGNPSLSLKSIDTKHYISWSPCKNEEKTGYINLVVCKMQCLDVGNVFMKKTQTAQYLKI